MVWTISRWTRRHWRRPEEWPAYTVSQWQQCREDFWNVVSKPSPFAKNASRRGEHWQGHSLKDCSWRFAKTGDLFAFCSTLFDSREKDQRNAACRDLIATADSDPDFFKKTVTGDETWYFAYDPTTKCQSAASAGETSPRPKKMLFQKSHVKMLVIFFDWQGVIQKEFVPDDESINAVYYKGVMERRLNRIQRVRPGMCDSDDWFLLHDNAPSHNATIVKQFLAQRRVTVFDHPPYSPDLAPADYLLFPKVKSHLKGRLWLDFGHSETLEKYIKHHCNGRFLQRHPEAVWPCKSLCTVRRDVWRKLNNKSVISFTQILFIMPVLKLSRRTV